MIDFFNEIFKALNEFDVGTKGGKPTLEKQFLNEVKLRKNVNSQHVWSAYYIPIAAAEIIKKQGSLTKQDNFKLECLANSLMFKDLADGKLNEFYKFEEIERS
jgi:hypothetical protein